MTAADPRSETIPGLGRNWRQFSLLVVVNAFVGAMIGLERAVVPLLAEREFGLTSTSAMLSFIVTFGIVKAITNLVAGRGSERIGRKPLLVAGWIAALPVPFILLLAPDWSWVAAANVLLGINQGLCWSITVVMKIDLVGAERRGLAMGLNEFSGYVAVAGAAWASALVAGSLGFRSALFVLGIGFAIVGFVLTLFVRETTGFARTEAERSPGVAPGAAPSFGRIFADTSLRDRNLFACTQTGLVNNLNDGVAWGLFPILFASQGLSVEGIGLMAAIYPAVWGVCQIGTGALSDRWGRKPPIVGGMWMQAVGIWLIAGAGSFDTPHAAWIGGSVLLGLGTALVYPVLLAAIGDYAHPSWRASAVGVYRLWRDLGYAFGAVLSGVIADMFGVRTALVVVGAITGFSGVVTAIRMGDGQPSISAARITEQAAPRSGAASRGPRRAILSALRWKPEGRPSTRCARSGRVAAKRACPERSRG